MPKLNEMSSDERQKLYSEGIAILEPLEEMILKAYKNNPEVVLSILSNLSNTLILSVLIECVKENKRTRLAAIAQYDIPDQIRRANEPWLRLKHLWGKIPLDAFIALFNREFVNVQKEEHGQDAIDITEDQQ